ASASSLVNAICSKGSSIRGSRFCFFIYHKNLVTNSRKKVRVKRFNSFLLSIRPKIYKDILDDFFRKTEICESFLGFIEQNLPIAMINFVKSPFFTLLQRVDKFLVGMISEADHFPMKWLNWTILQNYYD